ncbi:MAG: arginase family protein [Nanoarchaeota archaeon]
MQIINLSSDLIIDEFEQNYQLHREQDFEYPTGLDEINIERNSVIISDNVLECEEILESFSKYAQKKENFIILFSASSYCDENYNSGFVQKIVQSRFNAQNIILIGNRKFSSQEQEFLKKSKIKQFSEINDFEAAADYITEKANKKNIFVIIDMNVIDSAFAPGVKNSEPLGLSAKEFFYLLRRILRVNGLKIINLAGIDISIDAKYDYRTIKLGCKIIEEILKNE